MVTPQSSDDSVGILDVAVVMVENMRLLVLAPLAIGLLALGISFLITPTFTATTTLLPPQQSQGAAASILQGLGSLGSLAGASIKNPAEQYAAFLRSRSVHAGLVDRFNLKERYRAELQEDALRSLYGNVQIKSTKEGLIAIDVEDEDPAFAAQLANAYPQELNKVLSRLAVTEAQQRRAFFEKQITQTKTNLTAAEESLQRSGINEGALRAEPRAAAENYAQLKAQLTAAEVNLRAMSSVLTSNAPQYRIEQTKVAALRAQVAGLEERNNSTVQGEYIARYRDFKYQETLFELYARQFELAKTDEAREGAIVQVLDAASPPERKTKPKKALITVVATLLSAVILTLFVFARQGWRNTVGSGEETVQTARLRAAFKRKHAAG